MSNVLTDEYLREIAKTGAICSGDAAVMARELLAVRESALPIDDGVEAEPVRSAYTLPPCVFRELVNSLRNTAVTYQGTQQLREQIARTLHENGLSAASVVPHEVPDAEPVYQMRLLDGSELQLRWVEVTKSEFHTPLNNPSMWDKRILRVVEWDKRIEAAENE